MLKRLVVAVSILLLVAGAARARTPDPTECVVTPLDAFIYQRMVVMVDEPEPAPLADITVLVARTGGIPVPDCYVEIVFSAECDGSMCFCDGLVQTGYTDSEGIIEFNLAAGGCCETTHASKIVADGIPIRGYDRVVSPDFNGVIGDCALALDDFISFGGSGWSGQDPCFDFDGDGLVGLSDFIAFGGVWCPGRACPEAL